MYICSAAHVGVLESRLLPRNNGMYHVCRNPSSRAARPSYARISDRARARGCVSAAQYCVAVIISVIYIQIYL